MKNSRKSKSRQSGDGSHQDSITVICRFRPFHTTNTTSTSPSPSPSPFTISSNNTDGGDKSVFYHPENGDRKHFSFDKMFGFDTTQEQIFNDVKGVVEAVMDGINGTILAYGQTSSGKSWTMEGILDDNELQGVIPRAVDVLFSSIDNAPPSLQFQIKVAYYEIYCEKVRDLLNPAQDNMKLREVKEEGFFVQDVTEVYCGDAHSVLQVVQTGKANRASAPTLMNAESSRSHSILSITVKQKDEATGRVKSGRLFLVDLAGSEKISKTGATGTRLEEAKNINSSLTTLGMVINALCDGAPHIPYRDSKLTRLLMDSLGGNSRTTMIICCSPEAIHSPETLSTLRFGERAKRIENHAKVNEELSAKELQVLLDSARVEILRLQKKLSQGICVTCEKGIVVAVNNNVEQGDDEGSTVDSQAGTSRAVSLVYSETQLVMMAHDALVDEADTMMNMNPDTEASALHSMSEDAPVNGVSPTREELEAELESERLKASEAIDANATLRAEISILRTSISELEARLLQTKLNSLNMNGTSSPRSESHIHKSNSVSSKLLKTSQVENSIAVAETVEDPAMETPIQHLEPDEDVTTEEETKPPPALDLTSAETKVNAVRNLSQDMDTLNTARSEADEIRSLLEQELRALEQQPTMATPRSRTEFGTCRGEDGENVRTSSSSSQVVAKLREEYESYIQRLMVKVLEEQQHRHLLEDKLEEFSNRNWRAVSSESTGVSNGEVLFKKDGMASLQTQRRMSVSSPSPRGSSSMWSMLGFSRNRSSPSSVAAPPLPLHTQ